MVENEKGIAPALTADEWAQFAGEAAEVRAEWDGMADQADALRAFGARAVAFYAERQRRPIAALALANAALPDGDPRKITHDDVDWIEAGAVDADGSVVGPGDEGRGDRIRTVAAKLRAILPPK